MIEQDVNASQSETVEIPQQDAETEALYSSFGVKPAVEKKEIEFPDINQTDEEGKVEPPAIEDAPNTSKKLTVKFDKKDIEVEINDDNLPEYVQKAMALDRQRDRNSELEKSLDRAAKLAGYKDHNEYIANFDAIEKAQQQKQVDQFEAIKQQVVEELIEYGVDEERARQYAENNPLVQQAKAAIDQLNQSKEIDKAEANAQKVQAGWNDLFRQFPDLSTTAKEDGTAEWLTPDMDRRIKQGYDPIDAYKLAHADTIQAQTKKQAEQALIKAQQLGQRSHAEGAAPAADSVVLSAAQLALAEEFGVSPKEVERQQQLLKNRR